MLFVRIFGIALASIPLFSGTAHAASLSLSIDNDGVLGTDREYTSGLFARWSSDPSTIGYSVEIGSQMWTPSDIEWTTPHPNERAYAGLLYLQGRVYHQNDTNAYKGSLMVGTVGPIPTRKTRSRSFTLWSVRLTRWDGITKSTINLYIKQVLKRTSYFHAAHWVSSVFSAAVREETSRVRLLQAARTESVLILPTALVQLRCCPAITLMWVC